MNIRFLQYDSVSVSLICLVLLLPCPAAGAEAFISPGLTPEQVNEWLGDKKSLLIVDIRKPPEFRTGHIPAAVNILPARIERRIEELNGSEEVLIYFINGKRTRKAEPVLMKHGVENFYHLEGAFFAWMKSGLKVENGWTKRND